MNKLFCGISTLMLVRGQFATCVFARNLQKNAKKKFGLGMDMDVPPVRWIFDFYCAVSGGQRTWATSQTRVWFLRMTVGSPVPREKNFPARCAAACAPSSFPQLTTLTNEHQRTESQLTGL